MLQVLRQDKGPKNKQDKNCILIGSNPPIYRLPGNPTAQEQNTAKLAISSTIGTQETRRGTNSFEQHKTVEGICGRLVSL